jgi:putative NADPH-quinone reductase
MMTKQRILLIQGHPDTEITHLGHLLEEAYARGAASAGHEVRRIVVAKLSFRLLRSKKEWQFGKLPDSLEQAQHDIAWAEHIVIFYPLWLGDMPALLKGFLEQVARPDFAFNKHSANPFEVKKLAGRSARVVVTMGMHATLYRWFFRAHSVKSLERNILRFLGLAPVRETLIGMVEDMDETKLQEWTEKLEALGEAAQ